MDEDARSPGMSARARQLKEDLLGEFSLTVDDVAGVLEVDRSTVYRYVQDGALAALKIGREYRLSEADVRGFLEALIARERQRVSELRLKALTAPPAGAGRAQAEARPPVPEPGPFDGRESDWGAVLIAVYSRAWEEARARGQAQTHPAHLLLALASDRPYRRWDDVFRGEGAFRDSLARQALDRVDADLAALRAAAEAALPPPMLEPGTGPEQPDHSPELKALVQTHLAAARESLTRAWTGSDALLLALYAVPETAAALRAAGAEERTVRDELLRLAGYQAQAAHGPEFAGRARDVVHLALDLAVQGRSLVATPEHLLLALATDEGLAREGLARRVLDDIGTDLAALRAAAEARLPAPAADAGGAEKGDPTPSGGLRAVVLERAVAAARGLGHDRVGTEHLLLGLYSVPETADLLERAGAVHARVRARIRRLLPPRDPQPEEREPLFGRYGERAQRVITVARQEAARRGTPYVSTAHILAALLTEEVGGIGRRALEDLGVDIGQVRAAVEATLPPPQAAPGAAPADIQFTPAAKAVVMERAVRAAAGLGHSYVGTEHLLLALYSDPRHAELLERLGALQEAVEERAVTLLGAPGGEAAPVLDAAAQAAIRQGEEEARRLGIPALHPGHVLLGLIAEDPAVRGAEARLILDRLGVDIEALRARTSATLPAAADARRRSRGAMVYTTPGKALVTRHAPAAARSLQAPAVGTGHLLLGLYQVPGMADLLTAAGAPEDAVRVEVARGGGRAPTDGRAGPGEG